MTKQELQSVTDAAWNETKTAIETIWSNINKGQQKQLYKLPEVKAILDRFGVVAE